MTTGNEFTLARMQNWMQSTLIRAHGQVPAASVEYLINKSSRLTAARHLNIYRQSYIARLRECMKNQFSALAFALGEELFQMFADQYIEAYPSTSYTLNELGAKFPAFLEETRPDAGQEEKESWIDFMIELASFEFSLSVIFDEYADESHEMTKTSVGDEELRLNPVFRLFYHRFPVCRYYLDVTRKNSPELPFEEETYCAVTRRNYRLTLSELKPAQYYLLERLAKGDSIKQAKEYLVNNSNFNAEKLDIVWKEWKINFIKSGFFVRF